MYDKRIKIFIGISLSLLLLCVLRLMQMQLFADSSLQREIEQLKERRGLSKQLKTLRGKIVDRHGRIVAADMPQFQVCINYQLSRYFDDRVVQARLAEAQPEDADPSLDEVREEVEDKRLALERVIAKCAEFADSDGQVESAIQSGDDVVQRRRDRIESTIRARNEAMWKLRSFIRWARSDYDPNLVARHGRVVSHVPFPEAMADLERQFPDPNERYRRIVEVDDIPEVKRDLAIAEILHKAFVSVDEAGTEAAAATAVIVGETAIPETPIEVMVNSPFIFLIRDIGTGTILFVGRVVNPTA